MQQFGINVVPSSREELITGLGSEMLSTGNHMARRHSRWSISAGGATFRVDQDLSPGQLYSTASGKLFNSGKILIVLLGLPASSKTFLSRAIKRYTKWLGVDVKSFRMSEYMQNLKPDLGEANVKLYAEDRNANFRNLVIRNVCQDILNFFFNQVGQLALYDASNIGRADRTVINEFFTSYNIKPIFIESLISNEELMDYNIKSAIKNEQDLKDLNEEMAKLEFENKVSTNKQLSQELSTDENLSYIKYYNLGEQLILNNKFEGYLINKIVLLLMNLKQKTGSIFFTPLDYGNDKAASLTNFQTEKILKTYSTCMKNLQDRNPNYKKPEKFQVWVAPTKVSQEIYGCFDDNLIKVVEKTPLQSMHMGEVKDLTEDEIRARLPDDYERFKLDPYHGRYPRAESYHDLAVRMESLLFELERTTDSILIFAHPTNLRVIFGYFMCSTCIELPEVKFDSNQIVEIRIEPYKNDVNYIDIE